MTALPHTDENRDERVAAAAPPAPRVLVLAPGLALASAPTAGAEICERRPVMHTVFIGTCEVLLDGQARRGHTLAIPAWVPHRVVSFAVPHAAVAYLDPRRFDFAVTVQLAATWRSFVPGRDDLRDAGRAVLSLPVRVVDPRILRSLDAIEGGASVEQAAALVGLSASRLTHLTTDTLGAPPRQWATWFKLQRAIQHAAAGHTLTAAAHHAGFSDSAHLTRTCKRFAGVRPGGMMPQVLHTLVGS